MGGASGRHCDAVTLGSKCQTTCGVLAGLGEINDLASTNKTLCSWAEENVDFAGSRVDAHYDVIQPVHDKTDRWTESGKVANRLYRPGHLCRINRFTVGWRTVEDSYDMGISVGNGAYGQVHTGTHRRTGAKRAIKVVGKAALRKYLEDVDGFVRREVDILRRVDHPNIVRLYEAFEGSDLICLVLEFCAGGDVLERITVAKERMPERDAASLLRQMLAAIEHLHLQGIIHRDIKPENFLFAGEQPEKAPLTTPLKLIDFGLSKRVSGGAGAVLKRLTPKIGTTEYMAPEAYLGKVSHEHASKTDLWSLGILLHVVFVGHFPSSRLMQEPVEAYFTNSCWNKVSKSGLDLLGKLLQKEPRDRLSATAALKHPWLAQAANDSQTSQIPLAPSAVSSFALAPRLTRLGFAAAAREVDSQADAEARCLFDILLRACDGAVTHEALSKVAARPAAGSALCHLAQELVQNFDEIDMDQSGTLDWTEVLALQLHADGTLSSELSRREGAGSVLKVSSRKGALLMDAAFRAFDFLSGGGEEVTTSELSALTSLVDSQWMGTSAALPVGLPTLVDVTSLSEWETHMQELDVNGAVKYDDFLRLLRS